MNAPCNYCGRPLDVVLDMGAVALAGDFRAAGPWQGYPLEFAFCPACLTAQVARPVDPAVIFADVRYRASAVPGNRAHFDRLAARLVDRQRPVTALDIGCNDGVLAHALLRGGVAVTGVDASPDALDALAPAVGRECGFFGKDMARGLGAFDLITACNVLAHVADVHDFLAGAALCLAPGGALVIETHHAAALLRHGQYDDIYHEHRAYFSLLALRRLLAAHGFCVTDAEMSLHRGGTLRLTATKGHPRVRDSVDLVAAIERDGGVADAATYRRFALGALRHMAALRRLVEAAASGGRAVVGYGASGRAANLIQVAGLAVDTVFDDTPEKAGCRMPGSGIPIVPASELAAASGAAVVAFAWTYLGDIRARHPGFDWIVPFPEPRVTSERAAA